MKVKFQDVELISVKTTLTFYNLETENETHASNDFMKVQVTRRPPMRKKLSTARWNVVCVSEKIFLNQLSVASLEFVAGATNMSKYR